MGIFWKLSYFQQFQLDVLSKNYVFFQLVHRDFYQTVKQIEIFFAELFLTLFSLKSSLFESPEQSVWIAFNDLLIDLFVLAEGLVIPDKKLLKFSMTTVVDFNFSKISSVVPPIASEISSKEFAYFWQLLT